MSKRKNHILVVEDELPIRTMLRYALEMADFNVSEAADAKQAQAIITVNLPSLILLDWMLPHLNGVDFTKKLKQDKLTQNIPIILLTAKAEEENKVIGLESGADDYIVKPFSTRELIARIRAVLRRGPLIQPDGTLTIASLIINTKSQHVTVGDKPIKLGPLEYRLLCFLIMHQDRVYTRDELLTHVWGRDSYVDERTVDVHIRRLRKHLATEKLAGLIQTVHRSGYRMSEKKFDKK